MAGAAKVQLARVELDPRVERSRRVILEAVLEELGEVGYGAFTIEGVAARAGVGKSTIYRHWGGKYELVTDAFQTLKAQAVVPETGTVRERVTSLLEQIIALVAESTYSTCMPALIDAAERDPRMREFHIRFSADRRRGLVDLLQEGVDSGELPASSNPDLLADALVGPIVMRRLFMGSACDPHLASTIVEQVLPATPAKSRKR